jgi:hypothetical protein
MFYWSLKTLLAEPMRLMVSALAVAVSFVLVIFFSAVFEGESDQMVVYLEQTPCPICIWPARCFGTGKPTLSQKIRR